MKVTNFGNISREKLKKGVDLISDAIKTTLGPKGRNVAFGFHYGDPVVTKDGYTVARQMDTQDCTERLGLQLIRQVAQKTVDDAGDGTTTASLLAQSIFTEGLKVLGTGANPILIKRGIDLAVAEAIAFIKKNVILSPSKEDLFRVAKVSANNDPDIAKIICESIEMAGESGVITIEDSYKLNETYIHTVEGMQLNEGFFSNYFVTDIQKQEAIYQNPYVLIADYDINHIQPLMKPIEMILGEQKRPLVIVANNITGQALTTLVMNRVKGGLPLLACKSPFFGDNRTEQLNDLAILTGGRVIGNSSGLTFDKVELSDFGQVDSVVANKHCTTFSGGRGKKDDVEARIAVLQATIEKSESDYEREKLQERLAKLTGGVAVIKVWAPSEVELKEKKMRVEDALHATRAAMEEGIVPGGGVMCMRASKHLKENIKSRELTEEELIGWKIIIKALQEPIKQIAENSGLDGSEIIAKICMSDDLNHGFDFLNNKYGDLMMLGVIDPAKVVRLTIENAASVAGMLLTTECTIAEEIEDEYPRTPRPKSE